MGSVLGGIMGGGQHEQSSGIQPRAQEQILNPMGTQPQMGQPMQNMNYSNPNQQPQGFGSNPTNALSNIGRRF